ncbi:MAG: cytochrome P450 [Chloroflexota bacterium]
MLRSPGRSRLAVAGFAKMFGGSMAEAAIELDERWSEVYRAYCEGRLGDPYPLLAWLQEKHPIHWSTLLDGWFICGHADVVNGLVDPRFSSDRASVNMRKLPVDMQTRLHALGEHIANWLGFMDPPRHTEIRRLLARIFTPKLARRLEDRIRVLAYELVERLPTARADLVADLAHPLPLTVICDILGIPPEDRHGFWQAVVNISDYVAEAGPGVVAAAERAHAGVEELTTYFAALVERRRRDPEDDVVSQISTTISDAIGMSVPEILGICVFLFSAGHDTTTSLISSSALLLLQHPEALARLREDPALMPMAVDEFLRFEAPIPLISRVASENFDLSGHQIRHGDSLVLCVAAANRDPAVFPDPQTLHIDRTPNKELAFGWGAHFCLGAPLARLEARFALAALLDRLAVSRLEHPLPQWHDRHGLRALRELRIVPGCD